jgi:prepilin-type N-terminal cleavage/methylation domain-containing protein
MVRRIARTLHAQRGLTLVELLVVMTVLSLVLAPLTAAFASSFKAEVDQTNRIDAQENARLALNRLRKDIHCAHAVAGITSNTVGGQTLVLTQTNTSGVAECPGLVQTNAASVQWCSVPVAGAPSRYTLYRENDVTQACDGSTSTFEVDYLTRSDLFSQPTCSSGHLPTVAVALPVNLEPVQRPGSTYELNDTIALRNADACS